MTNCDQNIELWNAYLKGDKEAFGKLFKLNYSAMFTYGCKICADINIVEDAIQELFLELWQKKMPSSILSVKGYLLQALKFKLYKQFRNQKRTPFFDLANEGAFELSPLSFIIGEEEDKEKAKKTLEAINKLPQRQKEVIYLKIYKGLDYEDVGAVMDLSYQVVRNLLCQALKNVRRLVSVQI